MVARRPSVQYQALIAVLTLTMIGAVLGSLSGFWHMDITASTIFVYALGAVLFNWLVWRFPGLAGIALLAGAAVGVAAFYRMPAFAVYLQSVGKQAADFWAQMKAFQFDTTFGSDLGKLFLIGSALGVGLLVYGEAYHSGRSFWTLVVGTYIFGSQWAWYYDKSANYFMFFSMAAFALWILAQAAHRDAQWVASGRRIGYKSHVSTPMAWILVSAIAASILPFEFDPLDLGRLGDKIQQVVPAFRQMRGGNGAGAGRFSLKASGFTPRVGILGGPVQLDHSPALLLTTDQALTSTAYLRGITLNTYDGETWLSDDGTTTQVAKDGTFPTSYAADVPRAYEKFKIEHLQSLGSAIFSVFEPLSVDGLKVGFKANADDSLFADKPLPKGTAYTVGFRQITYSGEQIRQIGSLPNPGEFKTDLQLPGKLPDRVRALTLSATAKQQHPFDKAVALESFLRNQTYDLNVPATPTGRDFVDYFLFDLKRGYCTYYASAMTVMLRSLGVPARQVWGYALPPSAEHRATSDGKVQYTVSNSQAHAWVEAFFPGYGWVTFDPTPRADLPVITRDAPLPQSTSITPGTSGNETPADLLNPKDPTRNLEDPTNLVSGGGSLPAKPQRWPWLAAGVLALAGGVWLLYRRLQAQDQIRAREDDQVVTEVWDKSGFMLRRFGLGRRPDQTAREYARTITESWPAMGEPLAQVADDFTAARFARPETAVAGEATARARQFWEQIHELLITRFGWRLYVWRRFVPTRTNGTGRKRQQRRTR